VTDTRSFLFEDRPGGQPPTPSSDAFAYRDEASAGLVDYENTSDASSVQDYLVEWRRRVRPILALLSPTDLALLDRRIKYGGFDPVSEVATNFAERNAMLIGIAVLASVLSDPGAADPVSMAKEQGATLLAAANGLERKFDVLGIGQLAEYLGDKADQSDGLSTRKAMALPEAEIRRAFVAFRTLFSSLATSPRAYADPVFNELLSDLTLKINEKEEP